MRLALWSIPALLIRSGALLSRLRHLWRLGRFRLCSGRLPFR